MNDQKSNFSQSFLFGVIVGVAVAYLFGTKSGQRVKDELLKEGAKLLEKIGEGLEEAKEQVEEKAEKIAQGAQASSNLPQHIEEIQKKGRRFFFRRSRTES